MRLTLRDTPAIAKPLQIAVPLAIASAVLATGPIQTSPAPSQSQTVTQEATANDAVEPDLFTFSIGGFQYSVTANGVGLRSAGRSAPQRFTLSLDRGTRIERIWYLPLGQDLLLIYQDTDGESGAGAVVRLAGEGLQRRWSAHIPGFNIGQGAVENDHLYLTAIGFVAKLSLKTGHYAWTHRDLYADGRFNSFELPTVGETVVTFTDGASTIVVDKRSGARVK